MKDKNVETANTEKSRALNSRLFLGSGTRWTAITKDSMFIQSFLGFHRNCQSSTLAGKKREVVSYKDTRIDLQDLMHDCDQHHKLGYPIYTCAFETSPTKLKYSLERPSLAFLAKTAPSPPIHLFRHFRRISVHQNTSTMRARTLSHPSTKRKCSAQ